MMATSSEEVKQEHPCKYTYKFWRNERYGSNKEEYMDSMHEVAACKTVEEFWKIYCSLPIIGSKDAFNYAFFKDGIRPVWEDEENKNGGRVSLLLIGTKLTPYIWEKLLLLTIGEQFDLGDEICGVSVTVRNKKSTFFVWNRTSSNKEAIDIIKKVCATEFNMPSFSGFRYMINQDSAKNVEVKQKSMDEKDSVAHPKNSNNRFGDLDSSDEEESELNVC